MPKGTIMSRPAPRGTGAANDDRPMNTDRVPVYDTPETPLLVSFVGLSRAEQRAALAGFPGGRRFVLADEAA